MLAKFDCGVALNVPEGSDTTGDGSVFAPDGLELALYVENPLETPRTDTAFRKEIIEGRSYVEEFTGEDTFPDGWLVLFRTDAGLGFELGRVVDGKRIVFWADRLPTDGVRERALEICRSGQPAP